MSSSEVTDGPLLVEGERNDADLDDLVLAVIEAGGFGVEDDPPQWNSGRMHVAIGRGWSF